MTRRRTWTWEHRGHGTKTGRALTVNALAGMHRMTWATKTKRIRLVWAGLLEQTTDRPRNLSRVSVDVWPLHKDRTSPQDVGACAPEAKAAIDGLVDAGLIEDDDAPHLIRETFHPPIVCGINGMRLTITDEGTA